MSTARRLEALTGRFAKALPALGVRDADHEVVEIEGWNRDLLFPRGSAQPAPTEDTADAVETEDWNRSLLFGTRPAQPAPTEDTADDEAVETEDFNRALLFSTRSLRPAPSEEEAPAPAPVAEKTRPSAEPVYEVREVRAGAGVPLHTCATFFEASDFAFDLIAEQEPAQLVIVLVQGGESETVWTYSRERAASEASSRAELIDIFGYPVNRWAAAKQRESRRIP